MNTSKLLWMLVPGFVLISGNFSEFRIGPILPIFGLLICFVISEHSQLNKFFQKNVQVMLAIAAVTVGTILMAIHTITDYHLKGDEFEGAIRPIAYSLMSLSRYLLVILVLIVLYCDNTLKNRVWWLPLIVTYCAIAFPLYAQAVFHTIFNIDFGYLFPVENRMRYGGFIGEPQTISAWLVSIYLVLFLGVDEKSAVLKKSLLTFSILTVLTLTQSTAWVLSFFTFVLMRARFGIIALLVVVIVATGLYDHVMGKIIADIFTVSERTITILAGGELLMANLLSLLFGYGTGLTPYLIINTDVFTNYPVWNLSDLGRQTIMNSYLEVFCELGIIGGFMYYYIIIKASRIKSSREMLNILPILVGIFGISGGFSSGYFLISVPLILGLSRERYPKV